MATDTIDRNHTACAADLRQRPPTIAKVAARRRRLLWRIGRHFQTVTEPIRIGPLVLSFTRIAEPDRVLDDVAREADRLERVSGKREPCPLHLPYWAELWDSAAALGQFLVRETSHLKDAGRGRRSNILDLGCGMGLAGTVAAALGHDVVFADLEPPALLFARLNSLPFRRRVRVRHLDWEHDTLRRKFDLIVGSDILYERKQWEFLEPFWREHVSAGGSVLLGEPGRQTGDLFIPWIAAKGWHLQQFAEPVSTRLAPIRIFRIRH